MPAVTHFDPPRWLEALGWASLGLAFATVLYLLGHVLLPGHRQRMWIMNVVYPVTALYWGPVTAWFYRRQQRPTLGHDGASRPRWATTATAISHCGAGCTLGDILAAWLVFALGITVAGKALYADFILDFAFAWLLGIVFQYFTIVPMRSLGRRAGIWAAIKADTFSIIAFQVGLFLGMWIYQEVIFAPGLAKTTASYWMMMQLSMVIGFFTAWPVTAWLVRVGWKERM